MIITSPTLHVTVVKDDAGVGPTRSQGSRCSAGANVYRYGIVLPQVGSTIAELSILIIPPALHITVVKDGAGVNRCSRNRDGRPSCAEVDLRRRSQSIKTSSDTQLSVVRLPPALQSSVVKDGAGVGFPPDTETAVRPVPRLIGVDEGASVSVVLPPSPNCPRLSRPQHFKSPLSRTAHVCLLPAETATAVRPVPRFTETGVL